MDTAHNETRHGAFSLVTVNEQNEARISLYDYRMLRAFPLPRLPKDFHALREQLEKQLAAYDGTWSVYVQNLNTGQELIVNDRPMRSASVMKLFIMEAVYEAFERGDLPRNEDTVYLLRSMIINSSNESSNRLLTLLGDGDLALGVARVNELIRLRGYSDGTRQFNGFEDPNASLDPDHPNQITAKDVGLLLCRIYNRTFLSRRVCNESEQMMLDQATRYKIPRGLPEGEGAQCGNKSGETDTIANDAAVIYGPTTDYILIVLSNDWSNEDTANAQIAEVSKTVYNFFEHS
jgi:beta-lactamase class A